MRRRNYNQRFKSKKVLKTIIVVALCFLLTLIAAVQLSFSASNVRVWKLELLEKGDGDEDVIYDSLFFQVLPESDAQSTLGTNWFKRGGCRCDSTKYAKNNEKQSKMRRESNFSAKSKVYSVRNLRNLNKNVDLSSTCSDEATNLGPNQKVISFSLYVNEPADVPEFLKGLSPNLKKIEELFPGWYARIYTNIQLDNRSCHLTCSFPILLWCNITNIPQMGGMHKMNGRAWRFLALGDPTVQIFLSRDLDSTLSARERAAVGEWEKSNYTFHTMRDNYLHSVGMLGGLWGAKNYMLPPNLAQTLQEIIIKKSRESLEKGWDQRIVTDYIFRPYKNITLGHDSYFCDTFGEALTLPFSTMREGSFFIGLDERKKVKRYVKPCPFKCRPSYGKNWTYC